MNFLFIIIVIAVVILLWQRALRSRRDFISAEAPAALWSIRISEAMTLALLAGSLLVVSGTDRGNNGLMGQLANQSPEVAAAHFKVFSIAVFLILCGCALALFGKSPLGTILCAGALIGYGLMINGPGRPIERLIHPGPAPNNVTFTLSFTGAITPGEVIVNGVSLGPSPVKLRPEDLFEKIPVWNPPPDDVDVEQKIETKEYRNGGVLTRRQKIWGDLELTDRDSKLFHFVPEKLKYQPLYFQYRTPDGPATLTGSGGGGSSGSGNNLSVSKHFEVSQPAVEQRLKRLLDKARLSGFELGEDWFTAIDSYGDHGWNEVTELAGTDRRWEKVQSDYTRWRYGLDRAEDAESAWMVFEEIMEEADRSGRFMTHTPGGRAVEFLSSRLDEERLIQAAQAELDQKGFKYHLIISRYDGMVAYGTVGEGKPINTPGRAMQYLGGVGRGDVLPPRAYVLARAADLLDQRLDQINDTSANKVEKTIGYTLLMLASRRGHFDSPALRVVTRLGAGGGFFDFLERKIINTNAFATLQSSVGPSRGGQSVSSRGGRIGMDFMNKIHLGMGNEANKWLYYMAILEGANAENYRQTHAEEFIKLADQINQDWSIGNHWNNDLNFLFRNLDDPATSLAFQYWPHHYERSKEFKSETFQARWAYLARMEPLSTVEMYAKCFEDIFPLTDNNYADRAFKELERIAPKKRELIARRLLQIFRDHLPADEEDRSHYRWKEIETRLNTMVVAASPKLAAERSLEMIDRRRDQNVSTWIRLSSAHEDNPFLTAKMIEHENPAARLAAVYRIFYHPTPEGMALLDKLMEDVDESVREKSREASKTLRTLMKDSPLEYKATSRKTPELWEAPN